jgi:hypothetical protein
LNEKAEREAFVEKLEGLGWDVLEEVWVIKTGSHFRADVIGFHSAYSELGYFLFELKTPTGGFKDAVTKAHKQIVYRYIGSQINDYRWPTVKDSPSVFIYKYPRNLDFFRDWAVIRFFNRYGIGLLASNCEHVVFHPDGAWAKLHMDPRKNVYLDIPRLKKYLEARTFGPE